MIEFEEWLKVRFPNKYRNCLFVDSNGRYIDFTVRAYYEAWEAGIDSYIKRTTTSGG